MWVDLGGIEAKSLILSRFRLDGGTMFGQVPKSLWSKCAQANGSNRIPLVIRALLLRTGGELLLVEAGMGSDYTPDEAHRLGIELLEGDLRAALQAEGVDARDIGHLILTHLHFDHSSGVCIRDAGSTLGPALPRARVYIQRTHWEKASAPGPLESGSFRPQDLAILEHMDLRLLDGETEILPRITVRPTDGHTRGLQMVVVRGNADRLYYPSDLIPTLAHVRPAYGTAYDMWPERLAEEKMTLLAEVLAQDGLLVFVHDPRTAACRLGQGSAGLRIRSREEI